MASRFAASGWTSSALIKFAQFYPAKIVFITDPAACYGALDALAAVFKPHESAQYDLQRSGDRLRELQMKPLCDEVEGMRELHQQHAKNV
jgi:hypothetical protein